MYKRQGLFEAFTTTRDGMQVKEEDLTQTAIQDQNTGYLVTPQPLGADVYKRQTITHLEIVGIKQGVFIKLLK